MNRRERILLALQRMAADPGASEQERETARAKIEGMGGIMAPPPPEPRQPPPPPPPQYPSYVMYGTGTGTGTSNINWGQRVRVVFVSAPGYDPDSGW